VADVKTVIYKPDIYFDTDTTRTQCGKEWSLPPVVVMGVAGYGQNTAKKFERIPW
jgi:hypothetical protein